DLGLAVAQVSRGVATADVDGDGDLDFAMANQWAPSVLYRNDLPDAGAAFLGLHLRLPPAQAPVTHEPVVRAGHPGGSSEGRPAVGAVARVRGPGGRVQLAQVDRGTGHSGVRSPDLHFGLGTTAAGAVEVEIRYRDRG